MKIAFDLDDTLIETQNYIFDRAFHKYGLDTNIYPCDWEMSNYPKQIKEEIFKSFNDVKIMTTLKPILGSIELISELKKKGHEIIIVTARSKAIKKETKKFVREIFKVPCFVVDKNKPKLKTLLENKIDLYIDDKPTELETIRKNGIYTIMISPMYTFYNHRYRSMFNWVDNITEIDFDSLQKQLF